MNSRFSIIALLAIAATAFAATTKSDIKDTLSQNVAPGNIRVFTMGSGTGTASTDTMGATSGRNIYGPIALTNQRGAPAYCGFQVFSPVAGTTASTGNLQIAYQLLPTNSIADTMVGGWTEVDTIVPNGNISKYVSLDSTAAQSILIRLWNYGGTATALLKKHRVVFKLKTDGVFDVKR